MLNLLQREINWLTRGWNAIYVSMMCIWCLEFKAELCDAVRPDSLLCTILYFKEVIARIFSREEDCWPRWIYIRDNQIFLSLSVIHIIPTLSLLCMSSSLLPLRKSLVFVLIICYQPFKWGNFSDIKSSIRVKIIFVSNNQWLCNKFITLFRVNAILSFEFILNSNSIC